MSLSAAVRVQGQRGRSAGCRSADAEGRGPHRPDRLLGVDCQRRLALPHGDARQRRLSGRADDARRGEGRGRVGPGVPTPPPGNQCRSYGAAAIMRVPGRVHITWPDDNTLRLETDAGTQVRTFRFEPSSGRYRRRRTASRAGRASSVAQWETPGAGRGGRGAGPDAPRTGSLKVVTTNLKAGYLRKNGVPYSENATLTEYFDIARERSGESAAGRHRRGGRCEVSAAAVHRQLAVQEAGRREGVGPLAVFGDLVSRRQCP